MKSDSLKQGFNMGAAVFALAALIAIPLRTILFFTVLEGETGFYSEINFTVNLFSAVVIAAIAFFAVFGIIRRKKLGYPNAPEKRAGFGALAGFAAAGFAFDLFNCISALGSDKYAILEYAIESEEASTLATEAGVIKLQAVFAALSACYFMVLCLCSLAGKAVPKFMAIASLSPVIWSIAKLIIRFTRTISYIRVSDLMLEMLALTFLILFFMTFAQLTFGVSDKGCEWKLGFFGLSGALLLLICFVPRFIVTVSGNANLLYSMSGAEYCDICIALFAICTVITRLTDKNEQPAPEATITEE